MADRVITMFRTATVHRGLERIAGTNAGAAMLVAQMRAERPDATRGTTTDSGFQTRYDFFKPRRSSCPWPTWACRRGTAELFQPADPPRLYTVAYPGSFMTWDWAVAYNDGDRQGLHVHPNASITGLYYVTPPPVAIDQGENGKISFYNARPRANMKQLPFQATHRQAPLLGNIDPVLSWLGRSVSPFRDPGERICIAFNAKLLME